MIEIILIIFAVLFMGIRMNKYRETSWETIAWELLAGIFVIIAMLYVIFPIPTVVTSNAISYNGTTGSVIYTLNTITVTTTGPNITNYQQTVPIYMAFSVWIILCVILCLRDAIVLFFPKKLPTMQKM